jgi:3-oxoacyl-[acyl-carrier-protein] synthase III
VRIASVRHAVPSRRLTNAWVIENLREHNAGRLPGATLARLETRVLEMLEAAGTDTRWALDDGERAIDIARRAGRDALARAGAVPEDVDFVVYTGVGRGWLEPATGTAVQAALGLPRATAFDVLDACASWLRAMQVARGLLHGGGYRCGLVVNCECAHWRAWADWSFDDVDELDHRFAQFTIGEAATATVVTDENPEDDFHFAFRTAAEQFDLCMIPLERVADFVPGAVDPRLVPGRFFVRSRELLGRAVRLITDTFEGDPRLRAGRYDICFGHAATQRVADVVAERLGVADVGYMTHGRFGNTVSASVPLAMSLAADEGRLGRGAHVLVVVGSAGLTAGLAAFTY